MFRAELNFVISCKGYSPYAYVALRLRVSEDRQQGFDSTDGNRLAVLLSYAGFAGSPNNICLVRLLRIYVHFGYCPHQVNNVFGAAESRSEFISTYDYAAVELGSNPYLLHLRRLYWVLSTGGPTNSTAQSLCREAKRVAGSLSSGVQGLEETFHLVMCCEAAHVTLILYFTARPNCACLACFWEASPTP